MKSSSCICENFRLILRLTKNYDVEIVFFVVKEIYI